MNAVTTVVPNIWTCLIFEEFVAYIYILLQNVLLWFQRVAQNVPNGQDNISKPENII